MKWLKIAGGILVAILVFMVVAVRIILDAIGYTTTSDDLAFLGSRLPKVLDWLFSTPWWVPSLLMLALIGLAAWLLGSGLRSIAVEPVPVPVAITAEDIESAITRRLGEQQEGEGAAEPFDATALIEAVNRALSAIKIKDRLREVNEEQRRLGDILMNAEGWKENTIHWVEWQSDWATWKSGIGGFANLIESYMPNVRDRILNVGADDLLHATVGRMLFPDHDTEVRYKTFRRQYANYVTTYPDAMAIVTAMASQLPTTAIPAAM